MLSLFGADVYNLDIDSFREMSRRLIDESLELIDKEGNAAYYNEILGLLPDNSILTPELLLEFDENIQRHTRQINEKRYPQIRWKYFQYLTLLFTEIYLDWYFRDPEDLLKTLNQHLDQFNQSLSEWGEKKTNLLKPFNEDQLKKLAYWNATGSGKTLLLHINLLQYKHYLKKHRREHELNRIIVLTPNEGLTHQHLDEFKLSGIIASEFSKVAKGSMRYGDSIIDVIDMNKLKEEGKKKTVSVDQFEQNNLVLIDEGHRGAKGDVWSAMRERLARDGFTFEYSATLGQAVGSTAKLANEYAKAILFDYSYRYFHADGFGKDFQILNIDADDSSEANRKNRQLYLTACLLSFYQQSRVYAENKAKYKAFDLGKPLWVFVGSRVAAVRTESRKQVSDVVDILLFIAEFVREQKNSISNLEKLLSGDTGLLNQKNKDIFAEAFPYLVSLGENADQIFSDILDSLFNAPAGGTLHVEFLKGGDGELALRLGSSDENFGVINVGDAVKLKKLCQNQEALSVSEKSFHNSIFQGINDKDSKINLLIGSKRFSEGWNSYRVSTMGLMHVGKSEGSEIIQLFGRGVRLRGFESCMKRSRAIHWATKDNEMVWVAKDEYLPILETLNVFGVKSDYMARFNEFLEGEGIKKTDSMIEKTISIKITLPKTPLITVKIPDDINFKKQKKTRLIAPEDYAKSHKGHYLNVTLDWYPRVTAKASKGVRVTRHNTDLDNMKLEAKHLAFMDFDAIYKAMQQLKAERNWYNLNLSIEAIKATLEDSSWYTLYMPKEQMELSSFERYFEWQEIAITLLKKYCDRFYKTEKEAFEAPHRKYAELDPSDPNFFKEYKLLIDESEKMILQRIDDLQRHIKNGSLTDFNIAGKGEALFFEKHLYTPLLHLKKGVDSDLFKVNPTHLNDGEYNFVCDLRKYYENKPVVLKSKEIYLLRNQSRGRGLGFFEAGNFYPDFILWVLDGNTQHIVFVDPKGILHCSGLDDPKLKFFETVKELEKKIRAEKKAHAKNIKMHSFIISNTPLAKVRWWHNGMDNIEDFAERNVLFQNGDREYIERMFSVIV